MASKTKQCGKCGGTMQPGVIIDRYDKSLLLDYALQQEWVAGDDFGKSLMSGGLDLSGRTRRKVHTYCCETCGALESYADEAND